MSTTQGPAAEASSQHGPGQDGKTILLPPAPQPTSPAAAARRVRPPWGDHLLALLVLVLAFLTASTLARNSDLWFHLATGRLLSQRQFTFGTDPFAYTTGGVYWACHSWLFDLALYEFYGVVGGAGLVVLKALLVAALAGLLLMVRRPGTRSWLPAVCTTLALLAMSPRLLLQPACVSYFFLGLTLWLLWRQQDDRDQRITRVLLLLVCILWVNMDEWFLLGPALVALFWLGEWLAGQRRTPGWLVPAALAVCLLNPHTYHAFTLPSELSPVTWTGGLREDGRLQAVFASAWSPAYLTSAVHHPAGLAFLALALLGLVSFVLHPRALRDWRLLVWLPFAVLAVCQVRAVPFFAVVAAPITALNLQDFLATRQGRLGWLRGPGYVLLGLALVALGCLTWLGWSVHGSRQVAWDLQPDPSLRRAAEALHDWRREKVLPEGQRVFALSPEVAHYGAWFAPGEKFFFDHRYQLFSGAARDYEAASRSLTSGEERGEWRRVLRNNGVSVVVYSDRDPQRLFPVLSRAAADPGRWTLLDVAGQTLLVGWDEGRPAGAPFPPAFDPDRLALGPQDDRARAAPPPAPDRGPNPLLPPRDFRSRAARLPPAPSWESAAATMYLHYADDSEAAQRQQQIQTSMNGYAASLAGLPALPAGAPQAAVQLVSSANLLFPPRDAPKFLVPEQLGPYFAHLVQRSPSLPLLAVRAARGAVAVDPEDANAWLRLGHAYTLLRNTTGEGSALGLLPPLAQLRHIQIATALEQAVRLDPDHSEMAHGELAFLYGERNFLDQALEHRREELRLTRRAGPRPGESDEEFADRLETLDKDTAKVVQMVEQSRKIYAAQSRRLEGNRLAQADLALRLGLARQALEEILMNTPPDLLGSPGVRLELELLLQLGRADEVRPTLNDPLTRENRQNLHYLDLSPPMRSDGGPLYAIPYHWPAYEWLHALQAAAVGDYAEARGELAAVRAGLRADHERLQTQLREVDRFQWPFVGRLWAGPRPIEAASAAEALVSYLEIRAVLRAREPTLRAQQADLLVLEGLLALEQGDTAAARSAFVEAQGLCAGDAVPFAGAPIVALYLGKMSARE
jgi:hypothetical protein